LIDALHCTVVIDAQAYLIACRRFLHLNYVDGVALAGRDKCAHWVSGVVYWLQGRESTCHEWMRRRRRRRRGREGGREGVRRSEGGSK
jgi:hypothetical protein